MSSDWPSGENLSCASEALKKVLVAKKRPSPKSGYFQSRTVAGCPLNSGTNVATSGGEPAGASANAVEEVDLVADCARVDRFVRAPAQCRPLPLLSEHFLRKARDIHSIHAPPQPKVVALPIHELLPCEEIRPLRRECERAYRRPRQREELSASLQLNQPQPIALDHGEVAPVIAHAGEGFDGRAADALVRQHARRSGAHKLCPCSTA
eukprot:scaffold52801_cov27-Tisochrysis_lutea.AAC.1